MFRSTTLTLFFLIGIGLLFLGVIPLWSEVSRMTARIADTEALIIELQNLQKQKDNLVKIYNSVSEENIKKLEAVVPPATGAFGESFLYLFLENMARENGLRLESIVAAADAGEGAGTASARRAGTPAFQVASSLENQETGLPATATAQLQRQIKKSQVTVKDTKISLTLKGDYSSFKAFLKAIESNLRLIDITNVSVKSSDGRVSFSVTLKTYHQ